MTRPLIDLTGQTFGTRIVIGRASPRPNKTFWLVKCTSCNREREINSVVLRSGSKCQCLRGWSPDDKHDLKPLPVGTIVGGMVLVECDGSSPPNYRFLRSCGHSIVVHSPSEARNREKDQCIHCGNKHEHDGSTLTVLEWSNELNISRELFRQRLRKYGENDPRTYTVGLRRMVLGTPEGEAISAAEAARRLGVGRETIRQRIKRGWPEELATSTPSGQSPFPHRCSVCGETGHNRAGCLRLLEPID
jgi:hypothetical protein